MSRVQATLAAPFEIGRVTLRNRLVATAHASGLVQDGLPVTGDAEYWGRLAAGGAAMLIGGGTVVAPESAPRRGNILEAWRPEAVEPLRRRVDAIHAEGGVAVCQLVHLGRETLGAESYFVPGRAGGRALAARADRAAGAARGTAWTGSSRRSGPRRPTRSRPGSTASSCTPRTGTCSSSSCRRAPTRRGDGVDVLERVIAAIRALSADAPARHPLQRRRLRGRRADGGGAGATCCRRSIRSSTGSTSRSACARPTCATWRPTRPPLLDELARAPAARHAAAARVAGVPRPGGRSRRRWPRGADLVGMARALIADPDLPRKVLGGRAAEVRPCVACNEDCRTFDPLLLCTVNPDLAPPASRAGPPRRSCSLGRAAETGGGGGGRRRPGRPRVRAQPRARGCRGRRRCSTRRDRIGGQLAVAAAAPHRTGWAPLLDFYDARARRRRRRRSGSARRRTRLDEFDAVVLATGAEEVSPLVARARSPLRRRSPRAAALAGAEHVVVVDDGFGWWPGINVVELALAAGAGG